MARHLGADIVRDDRGRNNTYDFDISYATKSRTTTYGCKNKKKNTSAPKPFYDAPLRRIIPSEHQCPDLLCVCKLGI